MSAAAEVKTTTVNERDEVQKRLLQLDDWLLAGKLRSEAVLLATQLWQVSRRTAQLYVHKAMARLEREAEATDRAFLLRLSILQRNRLYQRLEDLLQRGMMFDPRHARAMIQAVQTALRLLDSRDRAVMKLEDIGDQAQPRPRLTPRAGGARAADFVALGEAVQEPEAAPELEKTASGPPEAQREFVAPSEIPPSTPPAPVPPTTPKPPESTWPMPPAQPVSREQLSRQISEALQEQKDLAPTAHLSILPGPKSKRRKRMRPDALVDDVCAACATETREVSNPATDERG